MASPQGLYHCKAFATYCAELLTEPKVKRQTNSRDADVTAAGGRRLRTSRDVKNSTTVIPKQLLA